VTELVPLSTELPSATDIDILFGEKSSANYVFQKPFFDNSNSATNSWLRLGENITSLTQAGALSGNAIAINYNQQADDYFINWVCYNVTEDQYLYVTDSAKDKAADGSTSVGDTQLVMSENIPSGWTNADQIALYRHVHENPSFSPDYTTPTAKNQGSAILVCGGRGSTVGYKPIWSGFLSAGNVANAKTFFSGTSPFTFHGTYVGEAEIKTGSGIVWNNVEALSTSAGKGLTQSRVWFLAAVIETDDGQRSTLLIPSTNYLTVSAADNGIKMQVDVHAALLNKRIRYINFFAGSSEDAGATTLAWSKYFWVGRWDLTSGTSWTHTATAGATPGYHNRYFNLDLDQWEAPPDIEKEDLETHLGSGEFDGSTVSYNYIEFVNDQIFVGDFYDYQNSLTETDKIRYSVRASNGISQLNSLRDLDETTQSTIDQGVPTSIQGLAKLQDKLLILKNSSCYYMPVIGEPVDFQLVPLSKEIGCDVPRSIVYTPFGVMWAMTGRDIYLWRGDVPRGLTTDWGPDFRSLTTTNKANWCGWYDPGHKSYNLWVDDSNKWYGMYFDAPTPVGFAWAPHSFDSGVRARRVHLKYDGTVIFTDNNIGVAKFDRTTYNGGSSARYDVKIDAGGDGFCYPYLDTGDYALTEQELVRFREWWVTAKYDTGITSGGGSFNVQLLIDGTAISESSWSGMIEEKTRWSSPMPKTAIGGRVRLKFNSAKTAEWDRNDASGERFAIIEVGFGIRQKRRRGSLRKSL